MKLHPSLTLALTRLDADDQDRLQALCRGDWSRVHLVDNGTTLRARYPSGGWVPKSRFELQEPLSTGPRVAWKPAEPFVAEVADQVIAAPAPARTTIKPVQHIEPGVSIVRATRRPLNAPEAEVITVEAPHTGDAAFDRSSQALAAEGYRLAQACRRGFAQRFTYHPDVLALYGLDEEAVEAAVRHPERVELRPETFDQTKRYRVLGFYRGDVKVIVGFRTTPPAIIYASVGERLLEPGRQKVTTVSASTRPPKDTKQLLKRLRDLGVWFDPDRAERESSIEVQYNGRSLGKVSTRGTTDQVKTDFTRVQRRVKALQQGSTPA